MPTNSIPIELDHGGPPNMDGTQMRQLRRILAHRAGSHVRRCHTREIIGEYSVGKHSANALGLLLELCPSPDMDMVRALLWHDVPEHWLGDLPGPALGAAPDLRAAYTELENHVFEVLGVPSLPPFGRAWVKAVDRLECYLWSMEQLNLGNRNIAHWPDRVAAIMRRDINTPPEALAFLHLVEMEGAENLRAPDALTDLLEMMGS